MIQVSLGGRALALVGLLVLALVPAACGGSGDGDDATGAQNPDAGAIPTAPGVAERGEQRELLAAHETMVAALKSGDAATYCDGLVPASRAAVPKYLGGLSCEDMVRNIAAVPQRKATKGRKVVKVEIDGDKGTVGSRLPQAGTVERARYVRSDGRWLARVVPATGPTDGTQAEVVGGGGTAP